MWTGEYSTRPTSANEWEYFNEGNAHMIFFNKDQSESNTYQDKVLVGEKKDTGCYLEENQKINDNFNTVYNKQVLRHPSFAKFITKQKLCEIAEGETKAQFMDALRKEADPKRREDRKVAHLGDESPFWLEKNLFYISPMMKAGLKKSDALIFFVEIKPKCCFDEIPTLEEISGYVKGDANGADVDVNKFYDKFFKNCKPSERKFVYRKLVGKKHEVLNEFNTADFYSTHRYIRSKAIKALIKEDWGNYLKILDENQKIVPHAEIMDWFKKWNPNITRKTVAEIIGRGFDYELVEQVAGLQQMFGFYADQLLKVQEQLEADKQSITEEDLSTVMGWLADRWKSGNPGLDLAAVKEGLGDKYLALSQITAFLMSLTSRDSSFLLRCAVSTSSPDFTVLEPWEEGNVHVMEDKLHVQFADASAVGEGEIHTEQHVNFLADVLGHKSTNGYAMQSKKNETDTPTDYYIKCRTNLCDVGLKPWNKLHEFVESNHKVNHKFVHWFLQPENRHLWE